MKLKIINPDWGMTKKQMEDRCRILSGYADSTTELSMECLTKAKVYLNSAADIVLAGPEILEMAVRAEEDGFDAVILYCFSDPVMEACRQAVSIPVIGAGQAACMMIPLVGYQGALILADEKRIPEKKAALSRTGLSAERIEGYEAIHRQDLDPIRDRECLKKELLDAGKRVLAKTNAQVLVLGCLSFLGFGEELSEELQVPVIDPGPASVIVAEGLVRQKLYSSKRAYLGREDMSHIL